MEGDCPVAWTTKFVPPDLQEFLEEHLPDQAQWYEVRAGTSVSSYEIGDYDKAVLNAKLMRRIFPSSTAMFYIWKETGILHEEQMF